MGKNRKNRKQNANNTQNNTHNTQDNTNNTQNNNNTKKNINKVKNNTNKAKNKIITLEKITVEKPYNPEEREANVLKNATIAINRLSTEILVMILSSALSGCPSMKIPYQSVQLSQICHHWRLAVLDHHAFWRFMIFNKHMTLQFFEKLRSRYKTAPSMVMVRYSGPELRPFLELLGEDASHVKTLYVNPKSYGFPYDDIVSFFPSLENVFCDDNLDFEILHSHAASLKALHITICDTDYHKLASNFHQLRWLNLKYIDQLTPDSVVELVQAFPNLQVLYIGFEASGDPETEPTDKVIALSELKVLTIRYCPVMHVIHAPKLTYADILVSDDLYHGEAFTRFSGFDFSRITHICSMIGPEDPYIMGKTEFDDIPPFTFNISPTNSDDDSIFDLIPTSYSNRFYFIYHGGDSYSPSFNQFDTTRFVACLKQATSLVEIILNKFVAEGDGERADVFPFFEPLIGATTVRYLNVLWGGNFELLCEILSNGTICPNLEKLTYSSSGEETQSTSHLLSCLETLMKERSKTCSKPLEVEIKGFDCIPPGELEQIEKLGLLFVQKEQEQTPFFFEKKDYFDK